jgi:adenine-specific DNA-methyltransferase
LVVNYDLPWNPQRIEQRIGRCHRYGQKHDVVVINFLNRKNAADKRVFELLSQKFKLFEGIFGASDQVLGALESGVDFEKRVNDIYQSCRTTEEIDAAFDRLQQELELQIQSRMDTAKSQLLEHFDVDVHQRLRLSQDGKNRQRSRFQHLLWWFVKGELIDCADFGTDEAMTFNLKSVPASVESDGIKIGPYAVVPDNMPEGLHHFRVGHPLAEQLIAGARLRPLEPQTVRFKYDRLRKVSPVEALQGMSGWLHLYRVSLDSLEPEDHLLFTGLRDDGQPLSEEACRRLFDFTGEVVGAASVPDETSRRLKEGVEIGLKSLMEDAQTRNGAFFDSEIEKLENWAADLKDGLESELKELQREIASLKREFRQAVDLQTKVDLQRKVTELERKRSDKRKGIFEAQDRIDNEKDAVLSKVEERLKLTIESESLFTIRWNVEMMRS